MNGPVPNRTTFGLGESLMFSKKPLLGLGLGLLLTAPIAQASSHREAPITALDHTADITDFYSFVSYDPSGPRHIHHER